MNVLYLTMTPMYVLLGVKQRANHETISPSDAIKVVCRRWLNYSDLPQGVEGKDINIFLESPRSMRQMSSQTGI